MCFWPDTKKQINPVLLKKFEILKKAKIYFDKEDELINHINNTWDTVDNWWNDTFTQQKIELFNKDLNLKPKNDSFKRLSTFLSNIKNNRTWKLSEYLETYIKSIYLPLYSPKLIKVGIIREEGSNGDREMAAAFCKAGFTTLDITMSDLQHNSDIIDDLYGMVFVGGFSFADVCGAAKGWYATIKNNSILSDKFENFRKNPSKFSLGICNGCQLMSLLGWIPGKPKLLKNDSGRFESRSSTVRIRKTPSLFFNNMDDSILDIWVAHGEGRFVFTDDIPKNNICVQYVDDDSKVTREYPHNPNGSEISTAAVCSEAVSYTHLTLPTKRIV